MYLIQCPMSHKVAHKMLVMVSSISGSRRRAFDV